MTLKKYLCAALAVMAFAPALTLAQAPLAVPDPVRVGNVWFIYELSPSGTEFVARLATDAEAAALNKPAVPCPNPLGLPRTNLTPPLLVQPAPSTLQPANCTLNQFAQFYQGTFYNAGTIYTCTYNGVSASYPKYPSGFHFNIPPENDAFRNIAFDPSKVRFDTKTGQFVIPDVPRFNVADIKTQADAGLIRMPNGGTMPSNFFRIYFEGNQNFRVFVGGKELSMPKYVEPPKPVKPRPRFPYPSGFPTNVQDFQSESGTLNNIGAPNTGPSGAGPGPGAGSLPGASGLPGTQHDAGNNVGYDIPPLPIPVLTWGSQVNVVPYQIHNNGQTLSWLLQYNGETFAVSMGDFLPAGKPDGVLESYITRMVPDSGSAVPGALKPDKSFGSFEEFQNYLKNQKPVPPKK